MFLATKKKKITNFLTCLNDVRQTDNKLPTPSEAKDFFFFFSFLFYQFCLCLKLFLIFGSQNLSLNNKYYLHFSSMSFTIM